MLAHPTLDTLQALGLDGMAKAFKDLERNAEAHALGHAEWLALLLEHEMTMRHQKRFEARARAAKLRYPASVEDRLQDAPRPRSRALPQPDLL